MIEKIIITSLLVMAIWATMWEGMIFGFVRKWGERNLGKLREPVYDCPICMTFWYGSGVYYLLWRNSWIEWAIVVVAAMGLNAVLVKLFPDD